MKTSEMPVKRPTRAQLRAAGCRTRRRSKRALGRPIRRIKRKNEQYRRWKLKTNWDEYKFANFIHERYGKG